jgi:uncharacterized protein (DUF1778 family)
MARTSELQEHASPAIERKRARLDIRASLTQKTLIEQAAALEGRSVSDFVLAYVQPIAERTVRDQQILELSARDSARFIDVLLNPPEPNAKLRAAWQLHRDR